MVSLRHRIENLWGQHLPSLDQTLLFPMQLSSSATQLYHFPVCPFRSPSRSVACPCWCDPSDPSRKSHVQLAWHFGSALLSLPTMGVLIASTPELQARWLSSTSSTLENSHGGQVTTTKLHRSLVLLAWLLWESGGCILHSFEPLARVRVVYLFYRNSLETRKQQQQRNERFGTKAGSRVFQEERACCGSDGSRWLERSRCAQRHSE